MIAEVDIDGDGRIDYDGMLFYFTYKDTGRKVLFCSYYDHDSIVNREAVVDRLDTESSMSESMSRLSMPMGIDNQTICFPGWGWGGGGSKSVCCCIVVLRPR